MIINFSSLWKEHTREMAKGQRFEKKDRLRGRERKGESQRFIYADR